MCKFAYSLFFAFTILISCHKNPPVVTGPPTTDSAFIDVIYGQSYTYKQIGSQVWITQNLNYAAAGSSYYENNSAYATAYGRFYDWSTALEVAPFGWHLPSDSERTTLTDFLGGEATAGGAMKATTLWEDRM